jgi:hypothetical protein
VKGRRLGVAISLGLMVGVAVAPAADAFGGRGGRGAGGAPGGRPPGLSQAPFKPGFTGGFPGTPFGFGGYNRAFPGFDGPCPGPTGCVGFKPFHGRFFNSPGFKGGFAWGGGAGWFAPWGTTTVYYGPGGDGAGPGSAPVTYYAPQYYGPQYSAPTYPAPAAGAISVAPAPPAPSVVAFPGGHYELRGDGVTAPYQWVWVPNPPSAPPAPLAAPPADAAPLAQPPSSDASRRGSQLYRWTDEQGTVHWTNRGEAVPTRYRKEAKYPPPA